jgi:S1-C subfamily serine protease
MRGKIKLFFCHNNDKDSTPITPGGIVPLNEMGKQNSLSDIVKKVVPSVVAINVFDEHRILKTIGTGFFVKEESKKKECW